MLDKIKGFIPGMGGDKKEEEKGKGPEEDTTPGEFVYLFGTDAEPFIFKINIDDGTYRLKGCPMNLKLFAF